MIENPQIGQEVYGVYRPGLKFYRGVILEIHPPSRFASYYSVTLKSEAKAAGTWTCALSRCFSEEDALALMVLLDAGYTFEELVDPS